MACKYEGVSKCTSLLGVELSRRVNKRAGKSYEEELNLDPHHLNPILKEIFRLCSTMVIAFPNHTYEEVRNHYNLVSGHNYTESISI